MLHTIKIPPVVQDLIKILLACKVIFFILLNILESSSSIRDLHEKEACLEHMSSVYLRSKNKEHSHARAFHYCNGGVNNELN